MADGMTYDDARRYLAESEADLEAVRGWPPGRVNKGAWETSCYARRQALRKLVVRLAAGPTERHEAGQLVAGK